MGKYASAASAETSSLVSGAIFLKNNLGREWFRGRYLLELIVNCKTIKINLCNAVNFP